MVLGDIQYHEGSKSLRRRVKKKRWKERKPNETKAFNDYRT